MHQKTNKNFVLQEKRKSMPSKYFSIIKKKRINLKEVQVNKKEKRNKEKLNRIGENEKHL